MTDGREKTRTPSLESVLTLALDSLRTSFRVAMPGRVEAYDPAEQKADVQPLIQDTFLDDDGENVLESLPIVPDVPIVFPRAGGFYLTLPVAKGDHVLLIVNDRSIDKFATGDGEETDPVDLRSHDLSDAVALIGFNPFAKAIADPVGEHALLGHEGGSVVALKADGEVHLGSIDAADWVALAGLAKTEITAVRDNLNALVSAFNAHVHATAAVGPPVIPTAVPGQIPATPPAAVGDVKADKTKAD